MDDEVYIKLLQSFTEYLTEKQLRKTTERLTIFREVCAFPKHFDVSSLQERLDEINFHVSRATLYNVLDVLVDAGVVVRHQLPNLEAVQFELQVYAQTHVHLFCTRCKSLREIKNRKLMKTLKDMRMGSFTPEYYSLYVYGECGSCRVKRKRAEKKDNL